MQKPTLGEQELALLRYIADHEPVTVGMVAEGFGQPRELSRSTVVTVMERLRKKGFLTRKKQEGVFHYVTSVPQEELLGRLVQHFIEKTLAGSLTPFVAYFARDDRLSEEEAAELERLLSKWQSSPSPEEEAQQ